MNSLKQTLLLSLAVVTFIIGVHRTTVEGLQPNYWIFMICIIALSIFRYNRRKEQIAEAEEKVRQEAGKRSVASKARKKK